MDKHHVVIVGGGIAGLCACLRLSHQGYQVTLIEKEPTIGGKIRQILVNGEGVDSGPTVFTMSWVFENLLKQCNENLHDHLKLTPLPVLARHFWGKDQLDLFADKHESAKAIREFSSARQAELFLEFCNISQKVYNSLEGPYIKSKRPTFTSMMSQLGGSGTKNLMTIGLFKTLWDSLAKYFPDPRLHQLFGRYATYCGSSPYLAPATLMLIAHVEMEGVWSIENGMVQLPKMIAKLAQDRGANIQTNTKIVGIYHEHGLVQSVKTDQGEIIKADSVIFNGDITALQQGLCGESLIKEVPKVSGSPSLSALTWSVNIPKVTFPLSRHTVFFDQHYASEFTDIFQKNQLPTKPTVYLCAQSRINADPNATNEKMLLLVNAPPIGKQPISEQEIEICQQQVMTLLGKSGLNLNLNDPAVIRTSPLEFNQLFPGTGGALYGMATHGWMSSFARPSSICNLKNLYLAGGSIHPGPGVPMAAMSGQLAAEALMARQPLIK
jgi:1-hydroxycarotenoid 3,4-desaturase